MLQGNVCGRVYVTRYERGCVHVAQTTKHAWLHVCVLHRPCHRRQALAQPHFSAHTHTHTHTQSPTRHTLACQRPRSDCVVMRCSVVCGSDMQTTPAATHTHTHTHACLLADRGTVLRAEDHRHAIPLAPIRLLQEILRNGSPICTVYCEHRVRPHPRVRH